MKPPPEKGTLIFTKHGVARIVKVYDFGTCDIQLISTGKEYRITGLGWGLVK